MAKPNWKNRTMWTGDNLDIMRGMNSESVDLIYLDPPFNSNEDYSAPVGSEAPGHSATWTKHGTGRSQTKSLLCMPLLTLLGCLTARA